MKRRAGPGVVSMAWLIGLMLSAGSVSADTTQQNKQQIQILCASLWPKQPEQLRECVERHTASADELAKQIEDASETSIEFAIAKSCIERAKVRPPSMIDWNQALACFKNRYSALAPDDES